jgi:GGDEF domain-containing protein
MIADGTPLQITISIGCTTLDGRFDGNKEKASQLLLQNADKALYVSKEQGRNRVTYLEGKGKATSIKNHIA